jgi:hypothetical protein
MPCYCLYPARAFNSFKVVECRSNAPGTLSRRRHAPDGLLPTPAIGRPFAQRAPGGLNNALESVRCDLAPSRHRAPHHLSEAYRGRP